MKRSDGLRLLLASLPLLALPASACIPVQANARDEAMEADAVFIGVVSSARELPPTPPLIEVVFTLTRQQDLKGRSPASTEVNPGCGSQAVHLHERVVVLRYGSQYVLRKAGGAYERELRSALGLAK